jgi:CRP-like cAMP-binding protein
MKKLTIGTGDIRLLSGALRNLSFFAGLSMGELERLIGVTNLYEYETGRRVFKKGEVGDALYIVHSGAARVVSKPFFLWPAKTIARLGPGDVFGEMALIDQPYRTATVVTDGPSKLFVLLVADFNRLCSENPDFLRQIRQMANARAFETKNS